MYACIHTYMSTYIQEYIHTGVHTYRCTYIQEYIHTGVHTYRSTHIQEYIHTKTSPSSLSILSFVYQYGNAKSL